MTDEYVPTVVLGTKQQVQEAIAQDRRINAVAMESASQGARLASLEHRLSDLSEALKKIVQIETEVAGCFASLELMRKLYGNAERARLEEIDRLKQHNKVERRALGLILVILVIVVWRLWRLT